jgi:soluble lytic murein transglycosylase-like protein
MNQLTQSAQLVSMPRPRQNREQRRRQQQKQQRIKRTACVLACTIAAGVIFGSCGTSLQQSGTSAESEPVVESELVAYQTTEAPTVTNYLLDGVIPLPLDTQREIFAACGYSTQRFCMVMAIAKVETGFDTDAVGDGGKSIGMMQINTKAQADRIESLGVTDLTDPVQGASVALDFLDWIAQRLAPECPERTYGTNEIFMAYNMGYAGSQKAIAQGITSTDYSTEVYQNYLEVMGG